MSNQPPKEIATPPDGYEWTGEVRVPKDGEPVADWFGTGKWAAVKRYSWKFPEPILRKAKPPTVIVELPREAAEFFSKIPTSSSFHADLVLACMEALEREND